MIQTRRKQILYVDDTEEQRYAMRRILEGAGYAVLEAATGAEALRALGLGDEEAGAAAPNATPILAVVLDVKLPDMSGYEVCRRIKADARTASMPVLQVSASFADPLLRAEGLSGGADAYVAQPVLPIELLTLVNALIRSRDAEKTLRFQAEVSGKLTASLDYEVTLATIEHVFVPRFADRSFVLLRSHGEREGEITHETGPMTAGPTMTSELRDVALAITGGDGGARQVDGYGIVAPLDVGRKRLGALVFTCDGMDRYYTAANLALATDLASRAALALQNASLYKAQQATQLALIQSEKLAAAGRLSAAIAHEINNPLESITNLMYLIDTSDEITPTLKGYVQEALSELSRLTHIARQSLGFYRELTGPTSFDLNESVDDTLNIYLKRIEAKRIEVERRYEPGPLELVGVKGEVRQVVSNLLVNAYDALSEGGRLRVETEALPAGAGAGERVAFRVIDDGPGIAPDLLARIFEPFFTTKQGTGTGLGLWVSETIVTKHGGTIEASSRTGEQDHGTVFEVILPVSPAE